jgi:hypothetical protein
MNEFPKEVIDELKYYVYRLIDPRNGETFYVGKGKGNRVFQHVKGAIKADDDSTETKLNTIRGIIAAGLEVVHVIHRHGMSKDSSLEVEAALIDAYPGSTNIMNGYGSNDFGPMHAKEIIDKYAAQEARIEHNVLMITINKSVSEKSLYDATRFAWKLSQTKIQKVEYVFAVVQGIIVDVFQPQEWKIALAENFPQINTEDRPTRIGFKGQRANQEVLNLYLRKRIPSIYRKRGASNPVKYSFK